MASVSVVLKSSNSGVESVQHFAQQKFLSAAGVFTLIPFHIPLYLLISVPSAQTEQTLRLTLGPLTLTPFFFS